MATDPSILLQQIRRLIRDGAEGRGGLQPVSMSYVLTHLRDEIANAISQAASVQRLTTLTLTNAQILAGAAHLVAPATSGLLWVPSEMTVSVDSSGGAYSGTGFAGVATVLAYEATADPAGQAFSRFGVGSPDLTAALSGTARTVAIPERANAAAATTSTAGYDQPLYFRLFPFNGSFERIGLTGGAPGNSLQVAISYRGIRVAP
jgi:hypothetical protein